MEPLLFSTPLTNCGFLNASNILRYLNSFTLVLDKCISFHNSLVNCWCVKHSLGPISLNTIMGTRLCRILSIRLHSFILLWMHVCVSFKSIYINLRRSRDCLWMHVCVWGCLCVGMCLPASFTYFWEELRCPHKRIVTITKVYIARNNIGPTRGHNTIRFRKN